MPSAHFLPRVLHLHTALCILGTETILTHVKDVSEVPDKQTLLSVVCMLPRSMEKAGKDCVLRALVRLRKFYLLWLQFLLVGVFFPKPQQIKARCSFLIITGYGNSGTRNWSCSSFLRSFSYFFRKPLQETTQKLEVCSARLKSPLQLCLS